MFSLVYPEVFKKIVFQILLHAIRSFPHCQSLLQCLDGSHEFTGRLCSKPPLLAPATHTPAPIRGDMASALSAARMAALMGQTSAESDTCQGLGPLWLASLCPLTPPPLQKPASAETPLPQQLPAAIPYL